MFSERDSLRCTRRLESSWFHVGAVLVVVGAGIKNWGLIGPAAWGELLSFGLSRSG